MEVKFTDYKINRLKKNSWVTFSMFITLCTHYLYLVPKPFNPNIKRVLTWPKCEANIVLWKLPSVLMKQVLVVDIFFCPVCILPCPGNWHHFPLENFLFLAIHPCGLSSPDVIHGSTRHEHMDNQSTTEWGAFRDGDMIQFGPKFEWLGRGVLFLIRKQGSQEQLATRGSWSAWGWSWCGEGWGKRSKVRVGVWSSQIGLC